MKTPTSGITTTSTFASTGRKMGVNAAGMNHVLEMLSNIYSNPSLAVVREYSCNALDSHVEAGNTSPILVTKPTAFEPTFTVQDFGVGLSTEGILDVYAEYGTSTKRESNELIGALGIGSKSAFAVGSQYIVTAFKDGQKTIALFQKDDQGAPTVDILLSEMGHDLEPNGVKVEVSVSDIAAINRAVSDLFATWKRGTVLVDGVEPSSMWDDVEEIAPGVYLGERIDTSYHARSKSWVVVMGSVAYTLSDALIAKLTGRASTTVHNVRNSTRQVILNVPIGSVNIAPSREELKITEHTVKTVQARVLDFIHALEKHLAKEVDAAPSVLKAVVVREKLRKQMPFADDVLNHLTYRGKQFGSPRIEFTENDGYYNFYLGYNRSARKVKKAEGWTVVYQTEFDKVLVVTNVPAHRFRTVQLASKKYLMETGGKTLVVGTTAASFRKDWFSFGLSDSTIDTMDFEEFRKFNIGANGARGATQYEVQGSYDRLTADELNELNADVLIVPKEFEINLRNPYHKAVIDKYTVVQLTGTQKLEVFQRKVPDAGLFIDEVRKEAQTFIDNLTHSDHKLLAAAEYVNTEYGTGRNDIVKFLKGLPGITNPAVKRVIARHTKLTEMNNNNTKRLQEIAWASSVINGKIKVGKNSAAQDVASLKEQMPLLETLAGASYRHGSHTPAWKAAATEYINNTTVVL